MKFKIYLKLAHEWQASQSEHFKCKARFYTLLHIKFLDAGIQDVSTSISKVHDLIERSPDGDDDGDKSDKHI